MMQVPIQAIPNQSFSVILDTNTWNFLLKTVEDTTVVGLTLNGTDILDGARAVSGSLIIPSRYEESGNFFFTTANFQLPFYTSFNVSQSLIYISAAELSAIRTPPSPPITAAYFDPIAALPLRFAPQGYSA
ncbi:phage baseplate plug family protein [Singulisphaera rosea]